MGEVYRADDLKLGQAVALKFLPPSLAHNESALARFHREVRVARQVSHPNVCRVFDIGEIDGQTFLTMEFVDGEDLASLIRRIGRLPPDKALDMARQLCAGLAAAHEHGVIHLDLKPANVMLDGRGRVRITDFGLAVVTSDMQDVDAHAGTPAYMSPEQLLGGEVTPKSDLYALGLLLYEIFTGKRPFDATSFKEMARLREKSTPTLPSHYLKEIDALVERVILRCLEKDPAKRPTSALQVAAALPGGDPLSAAIAAGETPSPEMVAAAGTEGTLVPWKAWALLGGVILCLFAVTFLSQRAELQNLLPGETAPEVLEGKARSIASQFGYTYRPTDSAWWYYVDDQYWSYASKIPAPARYREVSAEFPSPLMFTYRQSPQPLQTNYPWIVSKLNPSPTDPGDLSVGLDTEGRFCYFRATPPTQIESSTLYSASSTPGALDTNGMELDWKPFFQQAGIDPASATTVTAAWYPEIPIDHQFSWDARHNDKIVGVRAGTYRGTPVFFQVAGPWIHSSGTPYLESLPGQRLSEWSLLVAVLSIVLVSAFLARRNFRMGRGDARGAWRAGLLSFACTMLAILLESHRASSGIWG
jgi:serine/threonine-protein kinase